MNILLNQFKLRYSRTYIERYKSNRMYNIR